MCHGHKLYHCLVGVELWSTYSVARAAHSTSGSAGVLFLRARRSCWPAVTPTVIEAVRESVSQTVSRSVSQSADVGPVGGPAGAGCARLVRLRACEENRRAQGTARTVFQITPSGSTQFRSMAPAASSGSLDMCLYHLGGQGHP
jgi:hypothetical protein